ncbi:hypothetical protein HN51_064047 [Arachis hypogaea]|uniref:uncharacterized protein LOC107640392 isoform X1 n=1 Tax=Arachis ipaensis TaxID=130454 RepID=UPI0007AF01E8|nr:uncharacterized protein LOC107640392 isoform X1 [Arachis ipaensis]XP_025630420.1 uncharacterized protein LOC112723312 isoform X1 [Arachis hypogaea]QHO21643.1 uncharacterized protein DS421_11g348530 [Arachis hypogaea]
MSWLFKSNPPDPEIHSHGGSASAVKDDISLIFRGVANFLAPPPSSSASSSAGDSSSSPPSQALTGIRNDLEEISGSFKNSLSLLSSNRAVTGISKLASQLLQLEPDHKRQGDDDGDGDAVPGTTEEVVRFVKEISTRPDCWTEFPLPFHHADFSMSNSQREHALVIEQLVPEFVALRVNLCSYMNVEKFWMIYFLLILPRLNQHDFELLSTPKIVEARDVLLLKLEEKKDSEAGVCEKQRTASDTNEDGRDGILRETISSEPSEIVTEFTNAEKVLEVDEISSTTENWLEDKDIDVTSLASSHTKLHHEEDVSFSDLDDDKSYSSDRISGHREAQDRRGSSPDGSSDWVQLHEGSSRGGGWHKAIHSKGKDSEDESNDWLTVDEFN